MPWIPVEVLEPPAVESLAVKLIPPDYTGWPPRAGRRAIRALVGTRVEIAAAADQAAGLGRPVPGGRRRDAGSAHRGRASSLPSPAGGSEPLVVEKSGGLLVPS